MIGWNLLSSAASFSIYLRYSTIVVAPISCSSPLASDGYPVKYDKGLPISGLEEFDRHEGYYCFHAGTKFNGDQIVTNGGRVLGVTAKGKDLKEARANAYAATEWVKFDNKYMRHDIGKAIDEA